MVPVAGWSSSSRWWADVDDETVEQLLTAGARKRVFRHAALCVVRDGRLLLEASTPGDRHTIFDVASLTKVATATLVHALLELEERVAWLDGSPTVGDLLAHRTGLPAWRPLFAHAAMELHSSEEDLIRTPGLHGNVHSIYRRVVGQTRATAPRPTYSDLNFLALGFLLEERSSQRLPELAGAKLFAPLSLRAHWGSAPAEANVIEGPRPRLGNPAVETELVARIPPSSGGGDRGVDDDNAAALGGVAGHAGLWATAETIARLGDHLLGAAEGTTSPLLTQMQAQKLFERAVGSRTFGLDTPSGETPAIGTVLGHGPKGAAGHLGFTGCSLWMDRDAGLSIAFLSDAVSLARPNTALRSFRPELHDAVAAHLLRGG